MRLNLRASAPPREIALPRVAVSLAACLSVLLAAIPTTPLLAQSPRDGLTRWEAQARALLKELIEVNTTHSTGSTVLAAEAMAKHMRAAGFPAEDVVVVENAPRKGNLVVRLRGRDTGRQPMLLLSHIDVVEADPADWTLPPFEFIEKDGTFYGRGVADDKDEGAIHLTILLRMKAEGFVPDRDIIVALTADEEGGPANGVQWLIENRPELIRAEYALNEGGGGNVEDGKRISNDVQASEKKYANFTIEATNPGGHSSVPRPDNAIYALSAALLRIGAHDFPVHLNEVTREYFRRQASIVGGELGAAMRALVANEQDAAAAAIIARDPALNARMRTACVATLLEGGHAPNALPQRATANVNCRILPDESPEEVLRRLVAAVNDTAVTVTPEGQVQESPPSPLTPELLRTIEETTEEMWPGTPVVPTMSTGATDGLYLRQAGTPVYGVSGLFYEGSNAHGMNEHIPAKAFYEGLEFMYRLVRKLSAGPGV
ncbi:MAG TPA: M20/M25/M40 family metallo-hydrolase [Gemmatimonadaceae bacterium]|nr:M20/M25/M40 family metallo-hydrolase [Gemmatimonadaceae bacterium]